jgi:PKD repeat protein
VVWLERPNDPAAVEFDADGDGVPEVVDTRDEQFGYTYNRPGTYQATVTVRDRQGNRTTYKRSVNVMTPEAFDAEIQGRWQSMKEALQRRDFGPALECVSSMMRQRYDRVLHGVVQGDVEQALPPIRSVGFQVIEAVYESVRPPAGRTVPLDVRFQVDLDGVWRLAVIKLKGDP